MTNRFYSDEELTAFLDGEDDHAPVDAIRAALDQDPALAARVNALRVDRASLQDAFARVVPPQGSGPALPEPRRHSRRLLPAAAALAASLMVGVGFGWITADRGPSGWTGYVAAYQALYTSSTLVNQPRQKADVEAELSRVTQAIGKSVALPDLSVGPELQYRRAQILGYRGRALAQFAFVSSTGDPVALCILRNDEKESPVELTRMEGLEAATWSKGGYSYLLIGTTDKGLIQRAAALFEGREI